MKKKSKENVLSVLLKLEKRIEALEANQEKIKTLFGISIGHFTELGYDLREELSDD